MPVLVRHDPGCKWSRFEGTVNERAEILTGGVRPEHTDAAKRFSDIYNLHRAAGTRAGWIAIALADGDSDGEVYQSRQEAVTFKWPNERWHFYCSLQQPAMTVCQAESLLRYQRVMNEINGSHMDRDSRGGGLEVIPRLAAEDAEAQMMAVLTGRGAIPMGYREG
jgi:hypothetical protein